MDIDLDFADRNQILKHIQHIPAAIVEDQNFKKHNTGVYCHQIPVNPINGCASIDYKEAEQRGYFKLDFLNVHVYKDIKNKEHLNQLLNQEPLWDLLLQPEFSDQLFQLNGHSQVLQVMKPKSIEELAMVLAMIRPAKRHLIGRDWNDVKQEIWSKPQDNEYYFKKSHSMSYAALVVVHMNLICEKISYEYS